MEILEFKTSKDRYGDNRMSDSIGGLVFLVTKVRENRMVPRELVYFPVVMELNSDNSGGITVGEAIGACSRGICNSLVASYACMTSIFGSSCKGEKTSVAKRYLVKSFEESGEVFLGEAGKMFPEESDKIEMYVGGLPDMIHGSVMEFKPKTMQDAIEFATELMDKKISTLAECQAENKRKLYNNNQAQQQPPKKQGMTISYIARPGERKENQGHYLSDCSKVKNQNHKNQVGCTKARGMVHALGGEETSQDLNDMEDNINA
uniref:Reverse transcriptase domain-containing protein n=1 Tax=Tanacetum cinerariifolium TaxID=118510 RepID=A0A699H3X2_TANCI|nr:hypothetical protein [Tanacetum cinerariifolium]